MTKNYRHDKISRELSKTFFGGKPAGDESKKQSAKRSSMPSRRRPSLPLIPVLVVIAALLLTFIFIKSKKAPGPLTERIKAARKYVIRPQKVKTPVKPMTFKTFYDFEKDDSGWEIPLWAKEKTDHVAKSVSRSREIASSGSWSLRVDADFPGAQWTAAIIEVQQFLDVVGYDEISVDIFIPESCPRGLKAKIILTVGETWRWIEMARSWPLVPGEWVTIKASLAEGSLDWRRAIIDKTFKQDIRKIDIRIESNQKPVYSGPIFIDNIGFSFTED